MSVVSANRIALVSDRGAAVVSGAAKVSGATSRGSRDAVNLTLNRTGEHTATLVGGVSGDDDGRTALTIVRKGRQTEIVGTIGWNSMFKAVALTIEQESFGRSTMTGKLCGRDVKLTMERAQGVTTVSGKLGVYEEPATGTTRLTVREASGTRTYEGSTSLKSQGAVRLEQLRDGDTVTTQGKLGGWEVTELRQPASMRDLELFDTTLLIVLVQAMRRYIQNI